MGRDDDALVRRAAREARRAAMRVRETARGDDDAGNEDGAGAQDGAVDPMRAAREAARAAAVGAAVGAVRAFTSRQHDDDDDDDPELAAMPDDAVDEEPPREPEPEAEQEPPAEARRQSSRDSRPREGADRGQVERFIDTAREQLRQLFGTEPEGVSSFGRTRDGWRVTLEVVEVRRIPETTDVLASYEVELDRDGDLIAFERVRRYQRSEALDGSAP